MRATLFPRAQLRPEELEDRSLLSMTLPQVIETYGFNHIKFGNVKGDGTGQTIAIIGAYDAPNITSDLTIFDAKFGLSNKDGLGAPALTVAYPNGNEPSYDLGWAQEETLDVEWAHAIAPGAHILLVESASNNYSDLLNAVDYARNQTGVTVVSMSWGSGEFAGETAFDSYFLTPAGHTETDGLPGGVAFIASSGDVGGVTEYPASSPNVLAVGGTTLQVISRGNTDFYRSETAWAGSGGGISLYEPKPAFQNGVTQSQTQRTTPDVAFDADPYTGVYMYFSTPGAQGMWYSYGGTSIGAPQWAALIAIADQGRALYGLGSLSSSQLLTAIYKLPCSDFHDVTKGVASSAGACCPAGHGYDLATGRGTPIPPALVHDLLRVSAAGSLGCMPRPLTAKQRAALAIHTNSMPIAAAPIEEIDTPPEPTAKIWPAFIAITPNGADDSLAPVPDPIAFATDAISPTVWLSTEASLTTASPAFPIPPATAADMLFGDVMLTADDLGSGEAEV